jgi:hypothetical protein
MSSQFFIKDKNLLPENIRKGVRIGKVLGTLEGGSQINNQDITADSSTVEQVFVHGAGYDGIGLFTLLPYVLQSKTVDCSTSSQTVTPDNGYDGLDSVTVNPADASIDPNIQPSNIKSGVNILGVTGTMQGGGNSAKVRAGDASIVDDYTLTTVNAYGMKDTYKDCSTLRSVTFNNLTTISANGFTSTFENCSGPVSINFPALTSIDYDSFNGAFSNIGPFSVSFGALTNVGDYFYNGFFKGSNITSVSFGALTSISSGQTMRYAFDDCVNLTSISFPELVSISQSDALSCFNNTGLVSVEFPKLREVTAIAGFSGFRGCSSLVSFSCPELTTISNRGFDWGFHDGASDFGTMPVNVSFPKLSYYYSEGDAYSSTFVLNSVPMTVTVHPNAISHYNQYRNLFGPCTGIVNLTISANATMNVHLDWQPNLTSQSVLSVLTHLDANSPATVYFYSNGLTVSDDQQGSLQTAYDAAVTAGWTINNLTITPA